MVAKQREMGIGGGVVMEGRDIGTKVFPDAELKIFLDADPVIREQRRLDQQKVRVPRPRAWPKNFASATGATALAPRLRWWPPTMQWSWTPPHMSEDEVVIESKSWWSSGWRRSALSRCESSRA